MLMQLCALSLHPGMQKLEPFRIGDALRASLNVTKLPADLGLGWAASAVSIDSRRIIHIV